MNHHSLTAYTLALLVVSIGMTPAFAGIDAPDEIMLTGTVRDFCFTEIVDTCEDHPDFEFVIATEKGIVESTLGGDDKPVYAKAIDGSDSATTNGKARFDQWYRDVSGVNSSGDCTITLMKISDSPVLYEFSDSSFFPIDDGSPECGDSHFGNQGLSHNYHFTYELHTSFTYLGGESFSFTGDDDVWVFINDELAIDLGGVHGAQSDSVDLDAEAASLGLTIGETYPLDFFFAERHTTESNFMITTSIILEEEEPPEEPPVVAGELLSIDSTALFLAGIQSNVTILATLSVAGAGALVALFYQTRRNL